VNAARRRAEVGCHMLTPMRDGPGADAWLTDD